MSQRKLVFIVSVLGLPGLLFLFGCPHLATKLALESVSKSIEDYGTVSISGSTLIDPDPRFQFDLRLTGEQIFERNRIEGFSNVTQYEALDAEISVKAELMLNMLDQMAGTTDPTMLQQIKQKLGAAAFTTLAQHAADTNPALKPIADALSGITPRSDQRAGGVAGGGGTPGGDASDGGRALAKQATDQVTALKQNADAVPTTSNATDALIGATACVEQASKLIDLVNQAVDQAATLRNAANDGIGKNVAAFGAAAAGIKDVDAKIQAARDAIKALKTKVDNAKSAENPSTPPNSDADKKTLANNIVSGLADPATAAAKASSDASDSAVIAARAFEDLGGKLSAPGGAGGGHPPLEAPPIDRAARLALQKMPEFRDALPTYSGPMNLNLQQLIALSASDKMTLEMLRWLSYPNNYGPGKRIYLCMASVNITPGRITQKEFAGTVDLMMRYATQEKKDSTTKCCDDSDKYASFEERQPKFFGSGHPIIFAAHPFINTQVLDLRYSRRESLTIAVQLILNGYPAAARVFLDYARQREQDAGTLTGENTMVSYSNGRHVGFTFEPRFVALEDPAKINSKPAHTLQPQTIPVMLMIVCDEDQLNAMSQPKANCEDVQGLHQKPGLVFIQNSYWRRVDHPTAIPNPFAAKRLDEVEMYQRAEHLDKVYARVKELRSERDDQAGAFAPSTREEQFLAARMNSLSASGIGVNTFFEVPYFIHGKTIASGNQPNPPMLALEHQASPARQAQQDPPTAPGMAAADRQLQVRPLRGWINRPSTFIVEAKGAFTDSDFLVSIGSQRVNATKLSDSTLTVTIPPWLDTFDLESGQKTAQDREKHEAAAELPRDGGMLILQRAVESAKKFADRKQAALAVTDPVKAKDALAKASQCLGDANQIVAQIKQALLATKSLRDAAAATAGANVAVFGQAVQEKLGPADAALKQAHADLLTYHESVAKAEKTLSDVPSDADGAMQIAAMKNALEGVSDGASALKSAGRASSTALAVAWAVEDLGGRIQTEGDGRSSDPRQGRNLWAQLVVTNGDVTLTSEPIYFDYYAPTQRSAANPNRPDVEIPSLARKPASQPTSQESKNGKGTP